MSGLDDTLSADRFLTEVEVFLSRLPERSNPKQIPVLVYWHKMALPFTMEVPLAKDNSKGSSTNPADDLNTHWMVREINLNVEPR